MIKASFTLNWSGGEYSVRLHRELVKAVQKSAERVQRTAVKSLSVSGKSMTAKSGINKIGSRTGSMAPVNRFKAGMRDIFNLKEVSNKKGNKTLIFGGTMMSSKVGKIDRVYWYGPPLHRWVQSSPPGTPPNKQTGNLARIVVEKDQGGLRAKVGPKDGLIYARIQELGGKAMIRLPARPYMRPAFEQNQQAILFQFALAVQKAAK
jgi:phage gpG-like protein